jgi:hypothetical protein
MIVDLQSDVVFGQTLIARQTLATEFRFSDPSVCGVPRRTCCAMADERVFRRCFTHRRRAKTAPLHVQQQPAIAQFSDGVKGGSVSLGFRPPISHMVKGPARPTKGFGGAGPSAQRTMCPQSSVGSGSTISPGSVAIRSRKAHGDRVQHETPALAVASAHVVVGQVLMV